MLNLTLAAALGGAAIAGCTQKPPASAADGERTGLGPQYSAKKGLLLPEETRRSLGVRVVEGAKVPEGLEAARMPPMSEGSSSTRVVSLRAKRRSSAAPTSCSAASSIGKAL